MYGFVCRGSPENFERNGQLKRDSQIISGSFFVIFPKFPQKKEETFMSLPKNNVRFFVFFQN